MNTEVDPYNLTDAQSDSVEAARYADEHLDDRVILSERMSRAVVALEADRADVALRTLKEPFYYFTDDCEAWDAADAEQRRSGIESCLMNSAGLQPSSDGQADA